MKRLIKTKEIFSKEFRKGEDYDIEMFICEILKAKENGANKINFFISDDETVDICCDKRTIESDLDYSIRLSNAIRCKVEEAKEDELRKEAQDRETYERLKIKYETDR